MQSEQYPSIRDSIDIPYFEEAVKRSIPQRLKKIRNTLLLLIAYWFPISKVRIILHRWRGVNISSRVYVGLFCFIDNMYPEYVYIEDNVGLSAGSMILTHFNPGVRFKGVLKAQVEPVLIKKGALVAVNSVIMPGVTIGNNAIIAANSVVYENVEDNALYRGNPAKKAGKFKLKT